MGALDWLSDLLGDNSGSALAQSMPFGNPTAAMPPQQQRMPMPPVQMTGQDAPPMQPPMPQSFAGGEGIGPAAMQGQPGQSPPMPPMAPGGGMPQVDQMGNPTGVPGPQNIGSPPMPPMPPGAPPINMANEPNPAAGFGGAQMPPGMPPGIPMPQPRPPGADAAPMQPPIPPGPRAQASPPIPPDAAAAVRSYERAGGSITPPPDPTSGPMAKTILGRAIGLDPNTESQMRGSLGAGLKAAGENSNKGKGAAFMGSLGAGIEGGKGADDKTTTDQDRFLGRQIQSKNADTTAVNSASTRELNTARTKLALEQAKMTGEGGKNSVVNSQQQLYLRAQGLVNNDPEVKLAKSAYDNALKQFPADSKEVQAAKDAHTKLVEAKQSQHLQAVGLDPKQASKIGKQPGMTQDNPVPKDGLTKEKFDALPPGSYFVNPKDGRLLKKAAAPAGAAPAAGGNQPAAAQSAAPATPPTPPMAAAGAGADNSDDEA